MNTSLKSNRPQKILTSLVGITAGLVLMATTGHSQGLTLNFANNVNAAIQFNGASDSFQFTSSSGSQWNITSEDGGSSAIGLTGSFLNGPFNYGPISSSGSGLGLVQYATIIGPLGNLVINSGSGNLSGTINWIDIATYNNSVGVLNAYVSINVTSLSYPGTNPDLQYLVSNQPGSLNLSFQFSPGKTLTALSSGSGPYKTSYSGSISVVPEPATSAIASMGIFGLLFLIRRRG